MAIKNPHDLIFQDYLSNMAVARDMVDVHLPEHIKKKCDINTLKVEPTSFVEKSLRKHQADVLYSLKIDGEIGYVYLLIEQQMKKDALMPFRILRYQISIMRHHLKQGHKKLPVVVPLLIYAGRKSPYSGTLELMQCFEDPKLATEIMFAKLKLIDLTVIPDEELKTHKNMAMLEIAQKHIFERDAKKLAGILTAIANYTNIDHDLFIDVLEYVLLANDVRDSQEFVAALTETATVYKDDVMTTAEYLKQQGMQEGMQQGILQTAKNMLAKGFDMQTIKEITGLPVKELAKLNINH
ncbi:MAG: Rpn family recombination-promoting nuclease/putative transposase [Gammaproteobacteria bacterium]|nr:Rpn family recombination-promoting nuclease/putative transposase [Gammaproteobacteria bacterium]